MRKIILGIILSFALLAPVQAKDSAGLHLLKFVENAAICTWAAYETNNHNSVYIRITGTMFGIGAIYHLVVAIVGE